MIKLENVCKYYRQGGEVVRAVDGVTLEVTAGDFVTITGRSGAGKTTLLSLVGGLTTPTAGVVRLFGRDLARMDDAALSGLRARFIGFVFQFASLIPTLTAAENVRLPGLFAGEAVSLERARRLLAWVGLAEQWRRYPFQLSGGQQARVALARALANQPELLLADEPTGNLDVETEREMLSLLRSLNWEQGITIVLVTHNPKLARFGNRHLVMDDGRLKAVGRWALTEVFPG